MAIPATAKHLLVTAVKLTPTPSSAASIPKMFKINNMNEQHSTQQLITRCGHSKLWSLWQRHNKMLWNNGLSIAWRQNNTTPVQEMHRNQNTLNAGVRENK
jgi:hypothetical protein